jgi:HAMP domain-containing protein
VRSIRTRLTVAFILVSLIPLLLVGVVLALQSFNVQRQQALRFQHEVTLRVSTQVQAFVSRLENQLNGLVKDVRGQPIDRQSDMLANLPSYPTVFRQLILMDGDGNELIKLDRLGVIGKSDIGNRANNPEFTIPKTSKETYYSPVEFDKVTGEPSMWISVPMVNPRTGQVDGVVASNIRFKEIWDLVAGVEVTEGESVYIVDSDNRIVAHLNPSVVLRDTKYNVPADGVYTEGGFDHPGVVIGSNTLNFGDLTFRVVAEKDVFQALALAIQTIVISVALLVVALILASAQGFFVAQQLTRPIQTLATVAEALSVKSEAFDPAVLTPVAARTDELGQLARVFQNMGAQVVNREQNLKQQVLELRIEIDEAKKKREVDQIVDSDMFRDLQKKANELRNRQRPARAASQPLMKAPDVGDTKPEPSSD